MAKGEYKYRARGHYRKTNRDSWITTEWRDTEKEAKDDIRMFAPHTTKHYTKTWIVKGKTPLEQHIVRAYQQRKKEQKTWKQLEKYGTKLPSGGHVWTGAQLIEYFEQQKKTKRKRR